MHPPHSPGREIREIEIMRYKVTIASEYVAAVVGETVSVNHGSWDHATDQVRGYGVVFITANHGEDADLCAEMDDHGGVIEYEAVGQTEAEKLAEMAEVLERQGEFFHGDRIDETAQEWLDAGFAAEAALDWMIADVWQPSVAGELAALGRTPYELRKIDDDLIYAWCNGDKAVVWPTTDDDTEAAQ